MLSFIGLGIHDEKDISLKALEEMRKCEKLFMETYTNPWKGSRERLEEMVGKEIIVKGREFFESDKPVEMAREMHVGLLIPGDPLSATTHLSLLMEARKRNIKTKVIHSSSIFTAIAETGLQLYKFGRTATIPMPRENYKPLSFYEAVRENRKMGLHTLLLVDTAKDMSSDKAFELLEEADAELEWAICVADLGGESIIRKWKRGERFDLPKPFSIIIPGKLHFMEKEFIETIP